jgi:hypothetical protein
MTRDRQLGSYGWMAAAGTAMVLVLAFATPASAKKFQMSGTWLQRKGQAFIPLQFGGNNGGPNRTHTSMGSFTEAPFFPTMTVNGAMTPLAQVVRETGVVTTTGFMGPMTPGKLVIKQGFFFQDQKAVIPLSGKNLIQITSMFQNDAPYATANFVKDGGPGSFTWCPFNAACTAGSALPSMKPTTTMAQGRQGRIVYAEGANQFGGTMQIGVRFGGIVSVPIQAVPFWAGHAIFGGSGLTLRKLAVGGGMNDAPGYETVYLARGYVTAPTMVPNPGSLIMAGPFVTTMFGNTVTMPAGVKFRLPKVPMTPAKTMTDNGQYTTNFGFPHTTGTVVAEQKTNTTGGWDRFSVMGTDNRTALGGGNLNTVAGALGRRNQNTKVPGVVAHQEYAQFDKLFLVLGFPTPSMSPAGFAAAGLLMLLGAGYAFRRRLG